jgi:hypothetical protein
MTANRLFEVYLRSMGTLRSCQPEASRSDHACLGMLLIEPENLPARVQPVWPTSLDNKKLIKLVEIVSATWP